MIDKPDTIADVLAEMRKQSAIYNPEIWADRIERAMAASAVQDDAKDAARFRWLRDHAINTEGAKGSPWCVYGLDLGDCTPAFGAELVAMVDDAMANGIVCSPVPVESLGRDAEPTGGLDAVLRGRGLPTVNDALGYSRNFAAANPHLTQTAKDHINGLCDMLEIAAGQHAPPPASVPDGLAIVRQKLQRFEDCSEDGDGCDIGREWFDALTTIGLLERTQRSPAWWTMTPAGHELLATTRPTTPEPRT